MPDVIRHPVSFWIPAYAGMTILGYLTAGVITPHSNPKILILAIPNTTFPTRLQKRENRRNDSPLDIMKIQVGYNLCRW
jgi:hypothetical protein